MCKYVVFFAFFFCEGVLVKVTNLAFFVADFRVAPKTL